MSERIQIGFASDDASPSLSVDATMHEMPANLPLPTTEHDLEAGTEKNEMSYAEREQELRGRIRTSISFIEARIRNAAQVAGTALILGMSNPVFAETPASSLPLTTETRGQGTESLPLPTYTEAKARLRASILTAPAEEVGYFVRTKPSEAMRTVILKKGESVSVATSQEELSRVKALIVSRQADVEMVHTHPLSAIEHIGFISHEEAEKVRSGERAHFSFAPSSPDWMMLVSDDDIYAYPPGQWSNRVIDTAGEWEYGISDSAAPFIRSLRSFSKEASSLENVGYTQEEKDYLEKLNNEHAESFFIIQELNKRQFADPMANSIMTKVSEHVDRSAKKSEVSEVDAKKFAELCEPFDTSMDGSERDRKIARMQEIASSLGFYIRYTPNIEVPQPRDSHKAE